MEIKVESSYTQTTIVFIADNVKVHECISEGIYAKKEDNKLDYSRRLGKDITDEYMRMFITLMDDIVYYREKEYDSSDLIVNLFSKLPESCQKRLIIELSEEYEFDNLSK